MENTVTCFLEICVTSEGGGGSKAVCAISDLSSSFFISPERKCDYIPSVNIIF